jgi:hypothetical protein
MVVGKSSGNCTGVTGTNSLFTGILMSHWLLVSSHSSFLIRNFNFIAPKDKDGRTWNDEQGMSDAEGRVTNLPMTTDEPPTRHETFQPIRAV